MIISSPYFLWALGLLSIPIIIHLFQFKRYKKLFFPDISLLKEATTKSKSQNQLKDLLILISRLAFIAALIMAFSEPFIPAKTNTESIESVTVYIDNSFSMQNEGMNGPLLREASQAAFEISESYEANVEFRLITNGFNSRQKRFLSQDEFLAELDNIDISGKHRDIEEVLKFEASEEETGNRLLYMISDFKAVLDTSTAMTSILDSGLDIRLLPLETQYASNISIDSAWTEEPLFEQGLNQKLFFKVSNHGDEKLESIPIRIELNSIPTQSLVLDFDPKTSIDTSIDIEPNTEHFITGQISTEDYPITFDNVLHLSIPIISEVGVSVIHGQDVENTAITSVFGDVPFKTSAMDESSLDLEKLESSDFIVLNGITEMNSGMTSILEDHLNKGNNVLLIPSEGSSTVLSEAFSEQFNLTLGTWDTTRQKVVSLSRESQLYNSVFEETNDQLDLPTSQAHWKCSSCDEEQILTLLDGSSLLSSISFAKGRVFKITSPLNDEFTNFHRHALFVPALINMAIRGKMELKTSYQISSTHLPFYSNSEQAKISLIGDSSYFIPSPSFEGTIVRDRFDIAGLYELSVEDSIAQKFAINYSRTESPIAASMIDEVYSSLSQNGGNVSIMDSNMESLKSEILEADLGVKLWPLFIVLSLLFLIVEIILLKVLKG